MICALCLGLAVAVALAVNLAALPIQFAIQLSAFTGSELAVVRLPIDFFLWAYGTVYEARRVTLGPDANETDTIVLAYVDGNALTLRPSRSWSARAAFFGMPRMYSQIATESAVEAAVFHTLAAAKRWLGQRSKVSNRSTAFATRPVPSTLRSQLIWRRFPDFGVESVARGVREEGPTQHECCSVHRHPGGCDLRDRCRTAMVAAERMAPSSSPRR